MPNTALKEDLVSVGSRADAPSGTEADTNDLIDNFSNLIAGMSRLLARLSAIPLFKDAEIGLTEWVALCTLRQSEGINNNQLANRLGVTRQRAHQIVAGLSNAGLITVRTSLEDSRKNELALTPAGKARLAAMNAELAFLLITALPAGTRIVKKMRHHTALLTKMAKVAAAPNGARAENPQQASQGQSHPVGKAELMRQGT